MNELEEALIAKIACKIITRRKKLGLSQAVVSEMLGLERSHYARIETGRQNISVTLLVKVIDILGFRAQDLLETER